MDKLKTPHYGVSNQFYSNLETFSLLRLLFWSLHLISANNLEFHAILGIKRPLKYVILILPFQNPVLFQYEGVYRNLYLQHNTFSQNYRGELHFSREEGYTHWNGLRIQVRSISFLYFFIKTFPDGPSLAYLEDSHHSVVGMRELVRERVDYVSCLASLPSEEEIPQVERSLFVLTAMSNFCGYKYDLNVIQKLQEKGKALNTGSAENKYSIFKITPCKQRAGSLPPLLFLKSPALIVITL